MRAWPALLTRMSQRPPHCSSAAANLATASLSNTSQAIASSSFSSALPRSDALAAARRAWSRPQMATMAPSRSNRRAVASPMPDVPPVTTATLSCSPRSICPSPNCNPARRSRGRSLRTFPRAWCSQARRGSGPRRTAGAVILPRQFSVRQHPHETHDNPASLGAHTYDGCTCMNNADLIVAILRANGITRGFGIPSGNVLPLMEAMRNGGVEFVLTAHEGSAGFAADVTGRMTGAPGMCIATLGPGATNLATGIGSAYLDRSPMLAITCNLNTDQLGRRIQMWIDHHALFKPITKATLPLKRGCIVETLTEAIRIALSEPQGPVHLDLPEDVALAPTNEQVAAPAQPARLAAAPDAAIARAAELIASAKRPIAVIGSSAMRLADPQLLRKLVERHSLPFATTTMAKGMIDEDHPLSLGCIERACRQVQRKLLRSADLIVGLGYDTIEVEYEAWIDDRPLLQIDNEPVDVAPTVKLVHQLTGDLGASLARLLAQPAAANLWDKEKLAEHRRHFQASLRPAAKPFTAH